MVIWLLSFVKIVVTRWQILMLKCTKFDVGWGREGALLLREGRGREGEWALLVFGPFRRPCAPVY